MATDRFPCSRPQQQPSRRPQLLELHRDEPVAAEHTALEQELLSFDADQDILSLAVMPLSIPAATRAAITTLIARRFAEAGGTGEQQVQELDTWLYTPHPLLGSACPFERIIAGDALAVLTALVDPRLELVEAFGKAERALTAPLRRTALTLLR